MGFSNVINEIPNFYVILAGDKPFINFYSYLALYTLIG